MSKLTLYVKADGDDNNDGISKKTPFQTLARAIFIATITDIKTIIILGTLDEKSESRGRLYHPVYSDQKSIFYIRNSGKDEILITGEEQAKLKGKYFKFNNHSLDTLNKRVIRIAGNSNIRLENILITGGIADPIPVDGLSGQALAEGGGILVSAGAKVTIGPGTVIKQNYAHWGGGGIANIGGTLVLDGGVITRNVIPDCREGGGIGLIKRQFPQFGNFVMDDPLVDKDYKKIEFETTFKMIHGIIEKNEVDRGGGLYIGQETEAEICGGEIRLNSACYGGGVFVDVGGKLKLTGGKIKQNNAFLKTDDDYLLSVNMPELNNNGGGICISGGFLSISGGSVMRNKARMGGGVFTDLLGGNVHISGGIIKDNIAREGNNVYTFEEFVSKKVDNESESVR
jgi:hypothetical protein